MLVEDNPDDEDLTLRALKRASVLNPVTVAHDGAEALQYLFPAAVPMTLPTCRFPASSCST